MQAEITATGKLVLHPESGTEAYALMRWSELSRVEIEGIIRNEKSFVRGSLVQIDLSRFPETISLAAG